MHLGKFAFGAGLVLAGAIACLGADPSRTAGMDFGALSLDELGSILVTSVSKKSENLAAVPAAISVITANDIHRSGFLTLPEVLRMAPGMEVARVDSAMWAVTVRGFNDSYAQKLLVLMDGRSIYTPLFSGTHWQVQDTTMEDIERIEVVRGPGGSVWGANAVNGVISIVSKSARATQGLLLSGGAGTERPVMAGARYGGTLGEGLYFRVYAKHDEGDKSRLVQGGDGNDAWKKTQGGFRLDWEPSTADRLTLQGDLFSADLNQSYPQIAFPAFMVPPPATGYNFGVDAPYDLAGDNLLGRWTRQLTSDSDFSLQIYHDRSHFGTVLLTEDRHTYDIDFRHRFKAGDRHDIVWGGGYRLSESDLLGSVMIEFRRLARSDKLFNLFLQDEISLVPNRLKWTLGGKIERNDYTGSELQPGTRLSWTPSPLQTIWASVARAVRTPSQVEHDARFNFAVLPPSPLLPLPSVVLANGTSRFDSETLVAYEIGYRVQPHVRLTFDVAAFVNDYNKLRGSAEGLDLSAVPNFAQVVSAINNGVKGQTYGGEFAATFQASERWRLHGNVSTIQSRLRQAPNQLTGAARTPSIASPEVQFTLRSSSDFGRNVTIDLFARYVDRIAAAGVAVPGLPVPSYRIPSYTTFDIRLAWRFAENLELSLMGQNLARKHREFTPTFTSTLFSEVGRSAYLRLTRTY